MISGTQVDASAVLAAARRARAEADAAEVEVFSEALAWASLHTVETVDLAATWGDTPVPLAGVGAPLVSEFCVSEFASVLGLSTDAGRRLISHALEVGHRLPRVWHRVRAGDLPVWKARRIAEHTIALSAEAALFVDRQVAAYAHRVSVAGLERLVAEAMARFMPQTAAEIAEQAADGRHVSIEHQHVSYTGTSIIHGELDLADALDLEKALQAGAQQLADLGSSDHLDARRAQALGMLARGDQSLELSGREVVLYVHLNEHTDQAEVENAGRHLLTKDQVSKWCGIPEARVIVKPVIDLNTPLSTTAYEVPDRIREHLILRDRTCVFPWCHRNARACDLDHIVPFDHGGSTSTSNLAPLCRRHHRLKTFGDWVYTMVEPGVFLWRSPHGYSYLRDQTGTRDLTPRPVEPPG